MKEIPLRDIFDSWQMTWRKESPFFFLVHGEASRKLWKPKLNPSGLPGSPYSTHLDVLGFQPEIKFEFIIISWLIKPALTLEADYEINYHITNAILGPLFFVW